MTPASADILALYPEPLVRSYAHALDEGAEPMARYGALLDAFEGLLRFLTFSMLSEYLAAGAADARVDGVLRELLLKGRLSSGDWSRLTSACSAALRGQASRLVAPELFAAYSERGRARHSPADMLEDLCHARNRYWGHPTGRDEALYARRLEIDLPQYEQVLRALEPLGRLRLCVPTRIERGRVVEVRSLRGLDGPRVEAVEVEVPPGRAGPERLQVDRSAILINERGDLGVLFPFMRWVDTLEERARGLYILHEWRWARQRGRPRLKSLLYVGGATGSAPDPDRALREVVEAALLPSLEAPGGGAVAEGLAEEDPDYSIPGVWSERAEALAQAIGREAPLDKVAALVARGAGGLIVVHGGPGAGKSWFAHQLHAHLRQEAALLHSTKASRTPQTFMRALIQQCGEALGRPLGEAAYRAERTEDLRLSLERHMLQVTRERARACVAIVDGLDELESRGDWRSALEWLPRAYPPGVFVVVTCRPEAALLQALRSAAGPAHAELALPGLERHALGAFVGAHAGDLAPRVTEVLELETAFERAAGNPLYLKTFVVEACRELQAAREEGRPPARLAIGQGSSAEQELAEVLWSSVSAPRGGAPEVAGLRTGLLELLAVAGRTGLSVPLLRAAIERRQGCRLPLEVVASTVSSISSFLRCPAAGRYLYFHLSLRDHVATAVMGQQDRAARHQDLVEVLRTEGRRLDEDYWAAHLPGHCLDGGVDGAITEDVLLDQALMAARAARRLGDEHGRWLRHVLGGMPAGRAEACAEALAQAWSPGAMALETLPPDQQEQVAEAFKSAGVRVLGRVARDIFAGLHASTGEAAYQLRMAWLSYQVLDEWDEAVRLLGPCIEALAANAPVEAARARRLHAAIAFDSNAEGLEPEPMLESCLGAFASSGLDREEALTHEVLGVVVDAEARWAEAERHYAWAAGVHQRHRDTAALARVALNRSVAALFEQGLGSAIRHLAAAESGVAAAGSGQMQEYVHANRSLLTLLSGDLARFDALQAGVRLEEHWLRLTVSESAAVCRWLRGDPEGAAKDMIVLAEGFDELDDAWGALDNRLNLAFLHLSRERPAEAVPLIEAGRAQARRLEYPVGAAMAAAAWRAAGLPVEEVGDELRFFDRHLAPLFRRVRSPFVPCYVLLLP